MSSLADLPQLIGFFSYSREDDEAFEGTLSALRDAIQRELSAQLGRSKTTFRLWQDQEAIAPGKLWESEIKSAVEQAVFFIPIVTPRAVNSHYCKFEFETFLARERALGRTDLVFPLLYIGVPMLENEAEWRDHPVLSIIGSRQYVDWRLFRHLDVRTTAVREAIERFCHKVVVALCEPWVSPEERRKQQEIEAQQRVEEAMRRAEAAQEAEEEKRRAEAARRRVEEERQRAEAVRQAEEEKQRAGALGQALREKRAAGAQERQISRSNEFLRALESLGRIALLRSRRWLIIATSVLVAAAVVGGGYAVYAVQQRAEAARQAEEERQRAEAAQKAAEEKQRAEAAQKAAITALTTPATQPSNIFSDNTVKQAEADWIERQSSLLKTAGSGSGHEYVSGGSTPAVDLRNAHSIERVAPYSIQLSICPSCQADLILHCTSRIKSAADLKNLTIELSFLSSFGRAIVDQLKAKSAVSMSSSELETSLQNGAISCVGYTQLKHQ